MKAEPLTAIATSGEQTVEIDDSGEDYNNTFYAKHYDVWGDDEDNDK